MTTKRNKPRLGRGLSSLLGDPVRVEPTPDADAQTGARTANTPLTGDSSAELSRNEVANIVPDGGHGVDGGILDGGGVDGGMVLLELGSIVVNRHQPRSEMGDAALEALASSIRASGVMQPIAVRPIAADDGRGVDGVRYELIAGERRWRAAHRAGLERIPAIVRDLDDRACAEWALVENIQREDLNAIDRGLALRGLVERFGLSHAQVGERVGMDRSSVTNFIRLTELEPSIRELIRSGVLSTGHGKALLGLSAGVERERVAARAASEQWGVRRLEQFRNGGGAAGGGRKNGQGRGGVEDGVLSDLSKQIGDHLGTKVRVEANPERTKGRIVIEFYGVDHFEGLLRGIGVPLDS